MIKNIKKIFYHYIHLKKTFLFSGVPVSATIRFGSDIFIYKIGDYANYTEEDKFINGENPSPTEASNNSSGYIGHSNTNTIIIATISSVLGAVILSLAGFYIFKRYKKTHQTPIIPTP